MWSGFDSLTGLLPTAVYATAGAPRGPSTQAPASEGSGLIDIRAMQALIGGRSGGESRQASEGRDEQLPSFGGAGLDGLSATPLLTPAPAPAAPIQPSAAPNHLLFLIAGLLGLGILGLGALMLMKPPTPEPAVIVAAPVVADSPHDEDEPEPEAAEPEVARAEPEAAEPEPTVEAPKPPKPRARSRANKQPSKPDPSVATTPKSEAPKSKEIDVDCLLDNTGPGCKPSATATTPAPPKPKPEPLEELPNKLGQSEISTGLGPVKTAAKSCGSGTTVEIKFSVAGASGQVVSATPLGEHGSSAVGQCVAKAAKAASFPKFAATQQGFSFKFRL